MRRDLFSSVYAILGREARDDWSDLVARFVFSKALNFHAKRRSREQLQIVYTPHII